MKRLIALDIADLRYIEITCRKCNLKIVLDMRRRRWESPPSEWCCSSGLEAMSVSAVCALAEALTVLSYPNDNQQFRMIVEDTEESRKVSQ